MNKFKCLYVLSIAILSQSCYAQKKAISESKKPNIIFILLDDLGIGDVGMFFQNQRKVANNRSEPFTITPYLDEMAKNGAIMEQYCAAPVCAPSRASLLLGQSQGHANVRDNQFDKALADNYNLGNVMQMSGYVTSAIGKWGLQGDNRFDENGGAWPAHPLKRGFDYYYGYMRHNDGHEHYPKEGLYAKAKEVYDGYHEVSKDLDKCYTGDLFTAAAKKYIINHQKQDANKPFFLYLAYDTPHAVLEYPTQSYPAGFGLKGGLQWLGKPGQMINTASGKPDSWCDPEYANATYDDDNNTATPEVAWPETYKRYATITKRIDNQVHDVLMLLKDLNIDENTIVVFTSDNGPSNESYLPKSYVGFKPTFFGSSGQYDGIKRDAWEGGVRVPTIVYWPKQIKPNTLITEPSVMYDWLPTFTEVAGKSAPVRSDGVSLLPQLLGQETAQSSNIYIEYFNEGKTPNYKEFDPSHKSRVRKQMQMIRFGDTVAVRYDIQSATDDFEIYNVREDPKQINDLAKTQDLSKLQIRLKGEVLQMRSANATAPRPYDDALIPADILKNPDKGWKQTGFTNYDNWLTSPQRNAPFILTQDLNIQSKKNNSYLFDAYILIPENGAYNFKLSTTGKAFLKVHGIALIDEDYGYKSGEEKFGKLNLEKGYHHIRLYVKQTDASSPKINFLLAKDGGAFNKVSNTTYVAK